jgi:hypothetical protein
MLNMEKASESEKSDSVRFYTKLNEMRAESNTLDWTPDKFVSLNPAGTKGYHYISVYKMRRNLAPLFAKHKIEFIPRYYDVELKQVGSSYYWVTHLEARMIDTESGFETSAYSIGGAPVSDKGISISKAFALKEWLSDQFLLIDGMIDPEEDTPAPVTKAFVRKEPAEEEAAKSQILAKSIRPLEPVPPKTESVPAKVAKVESAPVDPPVKVSAQESAPAVLADDGVPGDKEGVPIPQMNAIKIIFKIRTQWAKDGKMSVEEYNQMSADYLEVNDSASSVVFIKNYRVIM